MEKDLSVKILYQIDDRFSSGDFNVDDKDKTGWPKRSDTFALCLTKCEIKKFTNEDDVEKLLKDFF